MKETDTQLTDAERHEAWAFYKNAARYGGDKALVKTIERFLWLRFEQQADGNSDDGQAGE